MRYLRKTLPGIIIAAAVVILLWQQAPAAGIDGQTAGDSRGKAVLLIVDRITWADLQKADLPVMKRMADSGVIGLMSTNPAGGFPRIPENTYATIGAGARVTGGPLGWAGFNTGEPYENDTAGHAFARRTGLKVTENSVVQLGAAQMAKANSGISYEFVLGAIGTALHEHGLKTAVLGNADMPGRKLPGEKYRRQVINIAMDSRGIVDYGDVSSVLYVNDPAELGGVRTDYEALLRRYSELSGRADFIVIETGDTARTDEMVQATASGVAEAARAKNLKAADRFIGGLTDRMDLSRDLLMVIVPEPPVSAMEQGEFLTPFLMAGRETGSGLAWSGTIKRAGLISNTDIAPTVLEHFGLPTTVPGSQGRELQLGGRKISARPTYDGIQDVTRLQEDTVFLYNSRYPLVKGYVNSELVVVLLCIAALVWRKRFAAYLTPVLLAFTVVPGVMLWGNYLPHPSLGFLQAEVAVITALFTLAALAVGRRSTLSPYIFTTGVTALIILGDIISGGHLARTSPFSYDVMSGARYYGLGNEYMGILLGCVITFSGLVLDHLKKGHEQAKIIMVLLFLPVIYIIGAPNLGTNVGGTFAAVAGLMVTVMKIYGRRVNKKALAVVLTAIAVVVAGFIAYDLSRPVEVQTHIGRTAAAIKANGLPEITNIIGRKWEMNWTLIQRTSWSWFYFISLLAMPFLKRRRPAEAAAFRERYPWFHQILDGITAASIFALLFNDSGIVAAALMIIYAAAPFLNGLIREDAG